MKNKVLLGVLAAGLILAPANAYALSGNATVEFTGSKNVIVGDTFTVKMNVKDVNNTYDGIVSLEGNLSFDQNMVEYVSAKSENTPYKFHMNEKYNYKIAGLDFTLDNGIVNNVTVYEFTFKALKEGNTNITLSNYKLTDSKDYVDAKVIGNNITIKEQVKEEVKEEVKETKTIEVKTEAKVNPVKKVEKTVVKQTVKTSKTNNTKTQEINMMMQIIKMILNTILK